MKRYCASILVLLFYASILPWPAAAAPRARFSDMILEGVLWVDVRAHGAVASYPLGGAVASYADQGPAFQNAIDNAALLGVHDVIVPFYNNNNYLIKSKITLRQGVRLIGVHGAVNEFAMADVLVSTGLIVFAPADNTVHMFDLETAPYLYTYGVGVENLSFYQAGTGDGTPATAGDLFHFDTPGDYYLRNVKSRGFNRAVYINGGIHGKIDHCKFVGTNNEVVRIGSTLTTTLTIGDTYLQEGTWGLIVENSNSLRLEPGTIIEAMSIGGIDIYRGSIVEATGLHAEAIANGGGSGYIAQVGVNGTTGYATLNLFGGTIGGTYSTGNGIKLDYSNGSTIIGVLISSVGTPLTTTANTRKTLLDGVRYTTVVDSSLAGVNDKRHLKGSTPIAGTGDYASEYASNNYKLWSNDGSLTFNTGTSWDYAEGYLLDNTATIIWLFQQSGNLRTRREISAPVFSNPKAALGNLDQSPSDNTWFNAANSEFNSTGTYSWIPVGAFAVGLDNNTGSYSIIVKTATDGTRKKLAIDNTVP